MNQIFETHSKVAASKVRKSFKTTDLAVLMALMVIIISVSGSIVSEAFQDSRHTIAKADVEHLAKTLFEAPVLAGMPEHTGASRGPASFGERGLPQISEDPWGLPYHYKIIKNSEGAMKVVVVSSGPNKKLETDLENYSGESLAFSGDDIGFVYDGSSKKTSQKTE